MAYLDQTSNFAKCTVSTGYNASATSIVLAGSEGGKLPAFAGNPYNLVWWNASDYADPTDDPNREIVRVTGRTGDTLTVTRGQESTSAATHNVGGKTYKMALAVTKKLVTDIESKIVGINPSGFRARKSGDQTVTTATWTKCLFATEEVDLGGMWDTSTSRLTPSASGPFAGLYHITWGLYVASPSSAQRWTMAIYRNGTIIDQQYVYASGTDPIVARMVSNVYCNAGDYFEAYVYQSSGSDKTMNASSDAANISGFLVVPGA